MDHNLINKLEGMRRVLDDIRLKRNYLWTKIDKYKRDKRRNVNWQCYRNGLTFMRI
jgi:hypothetical protein